MVSVTSTSSGGGELLSTGGAMNGSTTATWVMSAKFSCSRAAWAPVSQASPTVVQSASLSQPTDGGGRRPDRAGSPSQHQTKTPSSCTG